MKKILLLALIVALLPLLAFGQQPPVWITLKPEGLVHGSLSVPVTVAPDVRKIELLINGVKSGEKTGRSVVFVIPLGQYIRRLRVKVVGYDAGGRVVGEDQMVVNDPQPPFRIRLQVPESLPREGPVTLTANVLAPPLAPIEGVDFYLGEQKLGTATYAPYAVTFDPSKFEEAPYARATARARGGVEANDVRFWGDRTTDQMEVSVQQIPLSVIGSSRPLVKEDFTLVDNGVLRPIESLTPASAKPLSVIVMVDTSESMLEELPMVKKAVGEFARTLLRPGDELAVVAFAQRAFWMTPFTSDVHRIEASLGGVKPGGETHLYDTTVEMLYELQKRPGRKALVVFSDGVNQGGSFDLDHVSHYARYSGVPIYPVIRNTMLSRFMKLPFVKFDAEKYAQIARDSGATYFIVQSGAELPAVYRKISEELRNQYVVAFQTQSAGEDVWHPLGIQTRRRDVQLRIPRGYFP